MTTAPAFAPLKGVRILSLALNLPGPAALMRCREMGADCQKLEPPGGDPMRQYNTAAYRQLHEHIALLPADLKTQAGQELLHRELAQADMLLTSFRPSALPKLGLTWPALHRQYPRLSHIAIVGAPGEAGETPGHDLTYLAENDLVTGLDLPATLYADMGGSLMASEAVLHAVLHQRSRGEGIYREVALSSAAGYLALPRAWGLTRPGAAVGGGHAGYRIYPCLDGRVALAALEPHFAGRLCAAAGLEAAANLQTMFAPATHAAVAAFLGTRTRQELDALAVEQDIPLHTL
ncbi:MAG: L-carnitine dehydratase/bile acid-inducible protein [Polaromonas sp.]|nr:L-carnitine dehydratase/bile acid-inducible protein [Polaromonas sp.]